MSTSSPNASKRNNLSITKSRQTKTAGRHLTSEIIAADIAEFKKRGGRIEVLGNTPARSHQASTTFRSNTKPSPKAKATTAKTAKDS